MQEDKEFQEKKGRMVSHDNKKYSSGASHYYRVEWYDVIRSLDDGAATIWNPKYLLFGNLHIYVQLQWRMYNVAWIHFFICFKSELKNK